ncbi:MAG: hypothetical protein JRN13_06650 [Nitrososphaerota archaeon]|nr:hypothetical protein [Nitrososphaerota archaeon]MDG6959730.1 hypothetical protein [Nitrososphaerota archaeon]MDG6969004.1 hypothetical protein [Nitrososphaerota archaeon]MDG6972996.1 hypothetical protein [Nitrososphaerota archaeon]MDG6974131.1 hypothetical protein [Nitrososphaerota archaeon]
MPRVGAWESLGQLLSAGAAFFGLFYESPRLAALAFTLRGVVATSPSPEGAVGLAGLSVAGLGSFVGIVIGQLRQPDGNVGVSLLFWMGFVVLVLGDALFYALQPASVVVMLVGLISAALTGAGLMVALQRPQGRLLSGG